MTVPSRSSDLPIQVIRHVWIPLADGTRLAARIWLPEDAENAPVPAILEYIPYRKNDMTAARDETIHPEFARAGYASVRVDLRGSGDSEGIMTDEYSPTELDDGLQVIAWLAEQPWCDGKVGIIGKSWGGFNGLQLAALRPPALAAVITVCSTDDRYADDVHYNGGVVLGSEMLPWAATMLAYNARPPDPAVVGDAWREQWLARMETSPRYIETWLAHQRRDDYWRHGSVCEDYSAIDVPILAVGGLYDEYRTTLFRLLDNLSSPVRALLGPWSHNYPHQGVPGPAIDFIAESIRWWDHWMKGRDTGADQLPALRAYVPSSAPPDEDRTERRGRWVAEKSWPAADIAEHALPLEAAHRGGPAALSSRSGAGSLSGEWLQFGELAAQQVDQAPDDAVSATYTWPKLTEPVEIVGTPEVILTVSASQPIASLAVRLCDVDDDGASRLITAGLRNLTHHDDHERASALQPGTPRTYRIPLLATAHRFEPGQRIRLAMSAAYWPWAWPAPEAVEVTLLAADDDALVLPMRTAGDDDYSDETFAPPPHRPQRLQTGDEPMCKTIARELGTGRTSLEVHSTAEVRDPDDGLHYRALEINRYDRQPAEPASAQVECLRTERVGRDDWDTRVEATSQMSCDTTHFHLTSEITGYENDVEVFAQSWTTSIPRDFN
ncbi:CocE/NonD family hydrolase [Epidermidibacterium keratini]|uniref:CocE/NonD family hydrolase n=1 Tax=Epidermidibacterium keratini TaxID=1891644 RepID=A0A7L4YMP9_9ACTN|nr:CocE/NonD family hydrolase [Epidermidibacterium keratini]QHC00358.1 CocE/NonD family hydrolase [Epidermidibacterium keratini]